MAVVKLLSAIYIIDPTVIGGETSILDFEGYFVD